MGVWMSSRYQKFFQEIKEGRTAILDSGVSTELERQGAPMGDTHWSGRVSIDEFDILFQNEAKLKGFDIKGKEIKQKKFPIDANPRKPGPTLSLIHI